MGWSCLRADSEALDRLMVLLRKRMGHVSSSNGWGLQDEWFFEIDNDVETAIVGKVYVIGNPGQRRGRCNFIGTFHIQDGRVRSFPTALPSEIKEVNSR